MLRGFCVSGSVLCQAAGDTAWPGDEGGSTLVMCAYVLVILAELLNLCEGSQLERATVYYVSGGWEKLRKARFCFSFRKQEGNRIYKVHLCEWHKACLKTSNQWPKKTKCSSCSPLDSLSLLLNGNTTPPIMGCSAAFEWMKAQWICITSVHSETRNLSVWWRILWSYEDMHVPAWQQLFSLFYRLFNIMAQVVFWKSSEMHSIQFYSILWLNTHCSNNFFLDILIIFEIIFYSIPFYCILFCCLTIVLWQQLFCWHFNHI